LSDDSTVITSTANDNVKYVRSLHRRRSRYRERRFIVEGTRAVEEALKAGVQPAFLFHTASIAEQARASRLISEARTRGVRVEVVTVLVMEAMSDTVTPSGILAVLPMPECLPPRPLTWVLVVDRLRDPGNLGTILRSASAVGAECVMTTKGTVDAYSPKVVRAGMGAHWALNLCVDQPWSQIEHALEGLQVLLAVPRDGRPYWGVDWRRPTALIVGGEAEGASGRAERLATDMVTIPMRAGTESLNAAVAASVVLFEAARQRFTAALGDS
jgi:TrmH family RNA methyltransferase